MRHAPDLKNERGIALALAVFALVIIGALVAGTVFAGRLEMKGGSNSVYASQAFEAADAGLASTMGGWQSGYNNLKTGDSLALADVSLGGNAYTYGKIVRVSTSTFLIRSTGERRMSAAGAVLARRQLATLAKLYMTNVPVRAALAARGDLVIKGTADLYGANQDPPDWATSSAVRDACPADATTVPSAEVSGNITTSGTPTMLPQPVDSSVALQDSSMFLNPYKELIESANIVLPNNVNNLKPAPVAAGTPLTCTTSLNSNWGEPGTTVPACGSYFPVIYAQGNLTLTDGRGQGILLVNGDLTLAGNFTFAGIIITKGSFNASKGTNDVYGTVLANNATLDDQTLAGTPQVQFSTCAISRALNASGKAVPFGSRSWAQIY